MKLLGYNSDAKTVKGLDSGWITFILYLAPSTQSIPFGGRNTCPWASKGCSAACLFTAGRGRMDNVKKARIRKTVQYFNDREQFMKDLHLDIAEAQIIAKRENMKPCFRLNGTSDINWKDVIVENQHLQFYDYTKSVDRILENDLNNYHLTFSRSEDNDADCIRVLEAGKNVAVVFNSSNLPETYMGYRVVNGDENDLRFLDDKGVIVGLKAKGDAKKDDSGFVVDVTTTLVTA